MKVRAIAMGFYGGRRRVGDVFEVPPNAKGGWFVPVETKAEVKTGKPEKSTKTGKSEKSDKPTDELV